MPGTISVRPIQPNTRRIGPKSQCATASWCQPWSNTSIPRPSAPARTATRSSRGTSHPPRPVATIFMCIAGGVADLARLHDLAQLHQWRVEDVVLEHAQHRAGRRRPRRACGRRPRGRGRAASAPARGSRRRAPAPRPRRAAGWARARRRRRRRAQQRRRESVVAPRREHVRATVDPRRSRSHRPTTSTSSRARYGGQARARRSDRARRRRGGRDGR